jgi:hypothetical protein
MCSKVRSGERIISIRQTSNIVSTLYCSIPRDRATTSQSLTQDEYDNAFTQLAGKEKIPASQDEEGDIEPPRHKQSMPGIS